MLESEAIKAEWFLEGENPKIKLNWFLYEVALEYYSFIQRSKALSQYRVAHSETEIARFCTYYAKRMRKSVLARLAGLTDATVIEEECISDYYPENSARTNRSLLKAACEAWDSHLAVCEICPTRCISERDRYCGFFDSYAAEI